MIIAEATGARWPSRSSKPAAAPLRGRLGSTPRRFRHARVARVTRTGLRGSQTGIAVGSPRSVRLPGRFRHAHDHGGFESRRFESRGSNHGSRTTEVRHAGGRPGRGLGARRPGGAFQMPAPKDGAGREATDLQAKTDRSIRYSIKRISPARGPFCESSGVNSTRCPSRSSSNTVPRTELRWKKCSRPDSSRMNPNPLSMRSRAIVPVGIPVSSASESLRTSQELPHPQIPVVSDNEARTMAGAGERGNGNRRQV